MSHCKKFDTFEFELRVQKEFTVGR